WLTTARKCRSPSPGKIPQCLSNRTPTRTGSKSFPRRTRLRTIEKVSKGARWAVLLILAAAHMTAQTHPDLSGYWELRYDSMAVPVASLTAAMSGRDAIKAQVRHDAEAIRRCTNIGISAIMGDRSAIDLRQSPTVTAIAAKPPSSMRYIYTDGRKHPSKDDYDPTTNGHSIGHWDGDTLIVDTILFNGSGVTRIPGGGVRTPDSHLVERYRLLAGGNRLAVTFTWEDPKTFEKPHT